jgi:hypothetical protein
VWAAAGVTLVRTPQDRLHVDLTTVTEELAEAFARAVVEPQRRAS